MSCHYHSNTGMSCAQPRLPAGSTSMNVLLCTRTTVLPQTMYRLSQNNATGSPVATTIPLPHPLDLPCTVEGQLLPSLGPSPFPGWPSRGKESSRLCPALRLRPGLHLRPALSLRPALCLRHTACKTAAGSRVFQTSGRETASHEGGLRHVNTFRKECTMVCASSASRERSYLSIEPEPLFPYHTGSQASPHSWSHPRPTPLMFPHPPPHTGHTPHQFAPVNTPHQVTSGHTCGSR